MVGYNSIFLTICVALKNYVTSLGLKKALLANKDKKHGHEAVVKILSDKRYCLSLSPWLMWQKLCAFYIMNHDTGTTISNLYKRASVLRV